MMMVASEGLHWRYEVCEHSDGYLVRMRDLSTGDVEDDAVTIFRTLPVAFAFVDMALAQDRFAASDDDEADPVGFSACAASEALFRALSQSLQDTGLTIAAINAWEQARHAKPRRMVH